ncbi:protein PET117 homolog, mitochondrial [Ctenocephalides felis]|uniref:protein PET117 homolog, mitochondrial n=1 Tax=Ctenocephalides felis TaxID=7515 RepID=UPI000E6E26D0|nr:protein PET117 homolog, mitochondrial [Ctenocephalides felis]
MSLASKITFISCLSAAVGIIGYVHYNQNEDREKLHEGVIRDVQRQQQRKRENLYLLQKQIDLTNQLKSEMEDR